MLLDHFIHLLDDANCPAQGDDELPVIGDLVLRTCAAVAVLGRLVTDLVAADMEDPNASGAP